MGNLLYFGDNLKIMREFIKDESVDLIYLDPPFNSNASYNVLFKSPVEPAAAQVKAFEDTWHWESEAQTAFEELEGRSADTFRLLLSLKSFLGTSDVMAYLAMMAIRLVEMRRLLKPSGSIYLHCDPTASHYLKILMDGIFGAPMFRNEIIWRRNSAHSDGKQGARHFGRITDTILFYSKDAKPVWNQQYRPYDEKYVERDYRRMDADGRRYRLDNIQGPGGAEKGNPFYEVMGVARHWRYSKHRMDELIRMGRIVQTRPGAVPQYKRYLDEMPGVPLQNLWDDIQVINNRSKEMLGYQTQKPLSLLERIITVSSNPGDIVMDPFCGCGTAVHAAEKLERRWIGIDITYVALKVIRDRLASNFPAVRYDMRGIPRDVEAARRLAEQTPHEFQNWAISELGGNSRGKGADRGIDGDIVFMTGRDAYGRAIISVKGGKYVAPAALRELIGTVKRERADLGIFICFGPPSRDMRREAAEAGRVDLPGGSSPRIRIVTVEELLKGVNLGLAVVLDSIASAGEAKRAQAKRLHKPKPVDPKQKSMMLPLKGGRSHDVPRGKSLELPLEEEAAPQRRRAARKR